MDSAIQRLNNQGQEFTFSIKALSFHSRTSIRVHKHMAAKNQEDRLFFKETALIYCENLEVQIAVFCMLRDGNSYKDLLFVYVQPSVG